MINFQSDNNYLNSMNSTIILFKDLGILVLGQMQPYNVLLISMLMTMNKLKKAHCYPHKMFKFWHRSMGGRINYPIGKDREILVENTLINGF